MQEEPERRTKTDRDAYCRCQKPHCAFGTRCQANVTMARQASWRVTQRRPLVLSCQSPVLAAGNPTATLFAVSSDAIEWSIGMLASPRRLDHWRVASRLWILETVRLDSLAARTSSHISLVCVQMRADDWRDLALPRRFFWPD